MIKAIINAIIAHNLTFLLIGTSTTYELSLSVCHSLRTQKSPFRQGVRLHLPRKLHAPAHAGVVHQAGQGKAVLRGVAVAAGAPQLDAAACFPDLILKAVDVHRAADDLRLFALHFQRHGLGVLEIRQKDSALGANDTGISLQLLPDGIDALGVLVGADGQGGGEPVEAVFFRVLGRPAHPQPVTHGAPIAALRLVFKAGDGRIELLRVVVVLDDRDPQRVRLRHELFQLLAPAVVFFCRPGVGVIIEHRDVEVLAQLLQHRAGAGPAAGVEQKARPCAVQIFEHQIHLLGKIELSCHFYHPFLRSALFITLQFC